MNDNFLGRGRISPGRRGGALVSLPDSLFKQEWPDPVTTKRIFLLRRKRARRRLVEPSYYQCPALCMYQLKKKEWGLA